MKKATALLMALLAAIGLAACGNTDPSGSWTAESSAPSEEISALSDGETAAQTPVAGGKTLVVYYSATGNTEKVANYIAQSTGADLFKLEPAEPYTDEDLNYSDPDSRVVYEHDHPDERKVELVSDTVDNWDTYDTVFIGYPKIQYGFLSV